MVIAASLVAAVQMALDDLGIKYNPGDTLLTQAVMDVVWADRKNPRPNMRLVARRAWLLWLRYDVSRRKHEQAVGRQVDPGPKDEDNEGHQMIDNNAFYFLGGMLVLISMIQFAVGYYMGYRRAKLDARNGAGYPITLF